MVFQLPSLWIFHNHYSNLIYALWCLKSPVTRLCIQQLVQPDKKETIKAVHYWCLLWGESTDNALVTTGYHALTDAGLASICSERGPWLSHSFTPGHRQILPYLLRHIFRPEEPLVLPQSLCSFAWPWTWCDTLPLARKQPHWSRWCCSQPMSWSYTWLSRESSVQQLDLLRTRMSGTSSMTR